MAVNDDPSACVEASLLGLCVPMDSISLSPENERRHPKRSIDAIAASLREYKQQKPIVIDGSGEVLAGSGLFQAARELGWSSIAAVTSELDGSSRKGYRIADNRTAEASEWDTDALMASLDALKKDEDFPLEATGFSDEDFKSFAAIDYGQGAEASDAAGGSGQGGSGEPSSKQSAGPAKVTIKLDEEQSARFLLVTEAMAIADGAPLESDEVVMRLVKAYDTTAPSD